MSPRHKQYLATAAKAPSGRIIQTEEEFGNVQGVVMINGHAGCGRNAFPFICCGFFLLLLYTTSGGAALAQTQTPHSVTRTCGYSGGPSCPPAAVFIAPWRYEYTQGGGFYNSIDDAASAYESSRLQAGTLCTINYTGYNNVSGGEYQYGIEDEYTLQMNFTETWEPTSNPPCGYQGTSWQDMYALRTITCPPGTSLEYQSSPQIGPYCSEPSQPQGNPFKQIGPKCPRDCTTAGDPVDVSNANLYQVETDYVGGGSNPIKFTRSYNSVAGYENYNNGGSLTYGNPIMGQGWAASYFQYLLPVTVTDSSTTYNTVYAYRPDGRTLAFTEYNGVYSPDGDVADSLERTQNGWEFQTADDTIETYDASGRLVSIARRGQAPVTVNYASGSSFPDPPTSVSDAFGHVLKFSYVINSTGQKNLASITDPNGKPVSYSYDSYDNLTSVTLADGTTRSYSYGSSPNEHLLTTLTDEAQVAYANWTYNGSLVTSEQLAGGVDAYQFSYSLSSAGGSRSVTDPLGTTRTYDQQLIWGAFWMTSSSGPCPGCGEDQARTYDADGNVTTRTDFDGNETTYSYDETTNLETSRTEAYGTPQARTITTQWDPNWRQPDLITYPDHTVAYSYDSMGNVLTKTITDRTTNATRTWSYTYDSYGRVLTAEDPRGHTTSYTYYTCTTGYQCGELETVTDALGHVTTYNSYDANGRPLTITDPNGTVTTLTYDPRGRLTSRTVGGETTSFSYYPTGLLEQVTLPDGSSLSYTYDPAHRLTQVSDGLGDKIVYTLDAMGNRTATNTYDPSGALHRTHTRVINALNEVYQEVNAAGTSAVTTTFGYDNDGNTTSIHAPLSRNTGETYDALNRVSSITDPADGVTTFGYDPQNDLTSVKDPRGLTTSYSYDGFGDLTSQTSPDTGTTTNTYDPDGNLATSTDARGAVATYGYDALNRVTSIAYSLGGTTDQTLSFTYDQGTDGIGHLTGASDANHSMSWTYDALGEMTSMTQIVGGVSRQIDYSYTNGDLTSITTPSGQTVAYGYNANHQVTSIAVNGTTVLSGVTYEPFGPVDGWTWGNGNAFTRTFDGDGDITGISTSGSQESLSYDDASRVSGITNTASGASSWTYGYDPLDRLTSATSSSVTDGWTYDANGNRLSQTGSSTSTYSISATNNQITGIAGTLARSYGYDAAGDTLSDSTDADTYNDAGRLKSITNSSAATTFTYNALGQMIEATGSTTGTTLYVYDQAGHLLGEYDGSGNLIQETVWLGDIPVATIRPSGSSVAIYYVETDQLGTPREVIRPSDNTQMWTWYSGPFGSAAPNENPQGAGTFAYDLRFPGQIAAAWGSTFQNDNRDYDPMVGRFVESDPLGLRGGGLSTYAYVGGNPISNVDPNGLECVPGVGCWTTPAERSAADSGNYSGYYQLACADGDSYACYAGSIAADQTISAKLVTLWLKHRLEEMARKNHECVNIPGDLNQIRSDLAKDYANYLPNSEGKAQWPSALAISQIHWEEFAKFGLQPDTFGGTPLGRWAGPLGTGIWCPKCRP